MTNEELERALRQLKLGGPTRLKFALNKNTLIISVHRLQRSARSRRDESPALHDYLKCATTPEQTYRQLLLRARTSHQTVLAVGRELLEFIANRLRRYNNIGSNFDGLSRATMSLTHECRSRGGSSKRRETKGIIL